MDIFLCSSLNSVFVLPSQCVCGPSSSPPPAPSPTPACPSHLERPHLGDASSLRTLSDWPGSQMTAGMLEIPREERLGRREREKIMSQQRGGKRERERERVRVSQMRKGDSTSDGWQCVCKGREQETGLWQTQHPAADISSLAAMESQSAQRQAWAKIPPFPWINKVEGNSIYTAWIPRDGPSKYVQIKHIYRRDEA